MTLRRSDYKRLFYGSLLLAAGFSGLGLLTAGLPVAGAAWAWTGVFGSSAIAFGVEALNDDDPPRPAF